MRVAHLVHGYAPELGGIQLQLDLVLPQLARRGFELSVLARRSHGSPYREQRDGVTVYRGRASGGRLEASLRYTAFCLPLLRRLSPQIVHAHDLLSAARTARLARRLHPARLVCEPHSAGETGDVNVLRRRSLGGPRLASLVRSVDRFVAISDEIAGELIEAGARPSSIVRIGNVVDTRRFRPVGEEVRRARRSELGLGRGPVAVLAARLEPVKRPGAMVESWPAIRAVHPEAELVVLGEGSLSVELRSVAGPGVRLQGRVDDVERWLEAADVLVLPSAAEGLPNAALEAMACGRAVVASDLGGCRELIQPGRNGCLVPVGDDAALVAAVLALFGDPLRRDALGAAARASVEARSGLHLKVDALCSLYRSLVPMAREATP